MWGSPLKTTLFSRPELPAFGAGTLSVAEAGGRATVRAMDPQIYKVLHLVGVMFVFIGLGAVLAPGGAQRKLGMAFHGIGLLLLLVAGFGLIAKMKYGFPGWILVKIVILLAIGVLPILGKKGVLPVAGAWVLAIALGTTAAWMGLMKPF
ncbi:hypothetical protein BH23VER1_BH23VER1_15380 [soil metagenome]